MRRQEQVCRLKGEKMRSLQLNPPPPGSREQPERPASTRTYTLTQVRPQISTPDLTKTILPFFLACSLCSWLNGGGVGWGNEKERKHTHGTEHKEMCRRQQPTQGSLVGERRGQLGVNINTASAVIAQQVIMITTCSLGSFSLI